MPEVNNQKTPENSCAEAKNQCLNCHYARLVETLFCIETAKAILEDPEVLSDNLSPKLT